MAKESTPPDRFPSPRHLVISMLGAMAYESWKLGRDNGFKHDELPSHERILDGISRLARLSDRISAEDAYAEGFGHSPSTGVRDSINTLSVKKSEL